MSIRILSLGSLGILACALAACSRNSDNNHNLAGDGIGAVPSESEQGTGCIQGVIVNGLTRERVALPDSFTNQVYVVTPGKIINATAMKTKVIDGLKTDVEGEYYICGVPVSQNYPVYVKIAGYQDFYIDATVALTGDS